MDPSGPEFLSIVDERGQQSSSSYGTDRAGPANSSFDKAELIFCDIIDNPPTRLTNTNKRPSPTQSTTTTTDNQRHILSKSSYASSSDNGQLPICQSYSDLEESTVVESPKRDRFLTWFTKHFILTASDGEPTPDSCQRPDTRWLLNYREAAIYLEEGKNNDKFEYHPQAFAKLPVYLAVHNHAYYLLDFLACLLVLALAIFEKPAVDGFHLSESIHASMELFALSVIGIILLIKFHFMGYRYFFRHQRTMIKTCVLVLMITEAIVVLLRQDSHFRVTRSLRPVFLIDNYYFGGVRRVIRQTIQSLHAFLEMLLLQMFFLIFFSISAFYLFASIPNYEQFSTIWNSFVSLFVLLTTSNYPDVMMPAYRQGQGYVLFFVFFLMVNLYFLLNIMLAVVYTTFSQIEKDKFRKLLLHRRKACENAFRLLVTADCVEYITFAHFSGLLAQLKPKTSHLERYLMYRTLLKEDFEEGQISGPPSPVKSAGARRGGAGCLTLDKFYQIYEVLHLRWRNETLCLPWFERVPCLRFARVPLHKLRLLVNHRYFEYYTFATILLATLYQLLDATFGQERWEQQVGLSTSATTMCAIFIGLYTLEITLKLAALGPRQFFRRRWNVFDITVTVFALATFLLTQYHVTQSLSTSFFSFRSLKLIDLLRRNVHRYGDILGPFAFIIVKRFTSVTFVVLIVYYFFAIIAMEFFGGYTMLDCCKNTSIEAYYASTGTGQYFYYLNNFNDMATSFVTLFELMVVNNWPIIMKSYVLVTGTQLTSLFFMIFYMISLLVITIVIAFVIDTIQFQIKYQDRFGQETLSAKIQVQVRLTNAELRQFGGWDQLDGSIEGGRGTLSRLLSSPFPSSWSFLGLIFGGGGDFERMGSTGSVNHLTGQSTAINVTTEEVIHQTTEPATAQFRGTRFRDKFSYNIRMYSDEIQKWIQ